MDKRRNVFTYGSLMYPEVWDRVVRGKYASAPASIHGFRRVRVINREHPALIVAPNAAAFCGRVYFDVDAQDLSRLDHFETASYARVAIAVTVGAAAVSAQAYLAINLEALLDSDWCAAEFEANGLAIFLRTYAVQNAPPG
jgi:gamma-glutamylcyclotransferase (GGCT)/AIG2-like uncharacterized protein YtfP